MVRPLLVATLIAFALPAAGCSVPPLLASAPSVPRTAAASEPGATPHPSFRAEAQALQSSSRAREEHLLYPDNLPRDGNDLAAELEKAGAGTADATHSSP